MYMSCQHSYVLCVCLAYMSCLHIFCVRLVCVSCVIADENQTPKVVLQETDRVGYCSAVGLGARRGCATQATLFPYHG